MSTTTQTQRSTAAAQLSSSGLRRTVNFAYTKFELLRNLRMYSNLIFMVLLPVALFVIFGGMQSYSTTELWNGNGNVSAQIMVAMAMYGVVTATSGLAGSAAVELQQGWGRQLGLTPFTRTGYVLSKTIVALLLALLPIIAVYVVGASLSARMDAWLWPATAGLILVGGIVFALYGLAFGVILRSESAVSAASGLVVILLFLGNAFIPLSGFLLDLAPFTPVWGPMQLALWPLNQGMALDPDAADGLIEYVLWQPILNILVWSAIFATVAVIGTRRGTARR